MNINTRAEIESSISEAIGPIETRGHSDRAQRFGLRLDQLRREGARSKEAPGIMEQIDSILAGMGSFSDLSIVPQAGAELSPTQSRHLQ